MKTFSYKFKSVPIVSIESSPYKMDSLKGTKVVSTYNLSLVQNHVLELTIMDFISLRRWLFEGIVISIFPLMVIFPISFWIFAVLIADNLPDNLLSSLLVFGSVVAIIASLVAGLYFARNGAIDREMEKMVVRDRGSESKWKCVRENEWDKFVSGLRQR